MITVLTIMGTRPEVIKMAPVIIELRRHPDKIRQLVCVTGQHREILDQALEMFGISPDFDLKMMQRDQSLSLITARIMKALDGIVEQVKPDWILAQGDTTSVLVAALVAFYHKIPFGHIEAGLRTNDIKQPFPEEANRRLVDILADLCFAPTERANSTLLKEGVPVDHIVLTGNTVVDALQHILKCGYDWTGGPLAGIPRDKKLIVATMHRRESFGQPLREICSALLHIADSCREEGIHIVCPVHPNPNVRETVQAMLAHVTNISLLEPLDYSSLLNLMQQSLLVLTDSGGIQEEAPSLGVPVLIMRDTTERLEGVEAGCARLVGTSAKSIFEIASSILRNPKERDSMIASTNPYGDGKAAKRIVSALLERKSG